MISSDSSTPASGCGCGDCQSNGDAHAGLADLPRRRFLCSAVAGTVMALAGTATLGTRPAAAQSTLTPDEALQGDDGRQRALRSRRLPVPQRGSGDPEGQDGGKAGAFRGGAGLRGFPRAGRVPVRPEHRPPVRRARRRQHHLARSDREPRIWRCRARREGADGTRPYQLRRRQGSHRGQGSTRPDQRSLCAHPTRRGRLGRRSRCRDRRQRQNTCNAAQRSLAHHRRGDQGWKPQGRRSPLRNSERQGHAARHRATHRCHPLPD